MKKIAIIGGYGQVGSVIVQQLIHHGKQNLLIMGRNQKKMTYFAQSLPIAIETRQIDLNQSIDDTQLADIQMVIVCLDQKKTRFIQQCQRLGIDYLDITANSVFLKKGYQLPSPFSRTLTGIGLAPGITNLAVANYLAAYENTKSVDIDILLGIGDQHGQAAIDWTFSQLTSSYSLPYYQKPVSNFTIGKNATFGPHYGKKTTYNFDFADQHLLALNDSTRHYTTYLGFDVSWITKSLALLKKMKLATILKNKQVLDFLALTMRKGIIGSNEFVVKISSPQEMPSKMIVVYGKEEAKITGEIATLMVLKLLDSSVPAGNYLINELTTLNEVVTKLPRLTYEAY
jgi:saccharopine dehydrogenase-like NADP-dependent oxidoreductase